MSTSDRLRTALARYVRSLRAGGDGLPPGIHQELVAAFPGSHFATEITNHTFVIRTGHPVATYPLSSQFFYWTDHSDGWFRVWRTGILEEQPHG